MNGNNNIERKKHVRAQANTARQWIKYAKQSDVFAKVESIGYALCRIYGMMR